MSRKLRPALVVTLAACGGVAAPEVPPEVPHNPPAPVAARLPGPPFVEGQALQARDAKDRIIHYGSGKCWVELPYQTPPTSWRPPPTEEVGCPPEILSDPAFATCDHGSIHLKALAERAECICYFSGNPPPAPKDVPCPVVAIPDLAEAGAVTPRTPGNPPATNPPAPSE